MKANVSLGLAAHALALAVLVLGLALLLAACSAAAPSDRNAATEQCPSIETSLNTAFRQATTDAGNPGVQAVVMRSSRVLWSAHRGMAITETATPVTDKTLFFYGSFGKLMLTVFALHQVETGVLDLDEPISTYVGDSVAGSHVITVRMLLTHTGGYPDIYSAPETASQFTYGSSQYDPNRTYTFSMLSAGIHNPIKPGTRWEYSNTGFIVLAHVLTKTTGGDRAFERACMRFIRSTGAVHPMGQNLITMVRSCQALQRFAHGYYLERGSPPIDFFTDFGAVGIPTDLYGLPFGDSLFAGTALGAAQFLDGLFVRHRLLCTATLQEMIKPTPQSLATEEKIFTGADTYGMGTYRLSVGGRIWQGHEGGYGGFEAMGATDLKRGVTIVVVTNTTQLPEKDPCGALVIWRALAEAYASSTP